ncbi:MAG: sensor histidine kinase [Gemmatimonadaceae bacterium]
MRFTKQLLLHTLVVVGAAVAGILVTRDGTGWRDLLPGALAAFAIGSALAWMLGRSVSAPIAELRDVNRALAAGDLSARPSLAYRGEMGELATAVHRLAEEFGARITALESEDALLVALIDSLNEGVIAINARQQVVRINASGRQLLRVSHDTPFPIDRLPRDRPLHVAIQDTLRGISTDLFELEIGGRLVSLTARPLAGGGAVVAFFDLTPVRRLETVRRDFVANVSHELKTPLTIIGGFAETLAADSPSPARRKEFAEMIRSNAQRMQRIVDDLLDLSRIESGGWVPNPVITDVALLAAESTAHVQAVADEKEIALEARVEPDASTLYADRTAVRQILANLLENAVRHTASGTVSIHAKRENGGVWLSVDDTGPGIAADHLPRIFERFYRVDTGRARTSGGTGLGLAIVKHLAEAHGGRVRADSAVGRGTSIGVFFPARRDEPEVAD